MGTGKKVLVAGGIVTGLYALYRLLKPAPPPPPPGKAILAVDTEPVKGDILVDDVYQGIAPLVFEVEPGPHVIGFGVYEGYHTPEPITVTLAEGETREVVGIYEPVAPPPPAKATLMVKVSPATIHPEILIDGIYGGLAPITTEIDPDGHTIGFGYWEGYHTPEPITVTLAEGEIKEVVGIYEPVAPPRPQLATVYGRVTETLGPSTAGPGTGPPMPGVMVKISLYPYVPQPDIVPGSKTYDVVYTDGNGQYIAADFSPGAIYMLTFSKDGYGTLSFTKQLLAGMNEVNVQLGPPPPSPPPGLAKLYGKVTHAEKHEPLEGVRATLRNVLGVMGGELRTETGSDGRYSFPDLAPRQLGQIPGYDYIIKFEKLGCQTLEGPIALAPGDNELNVELARTYPRAAVGYIKSIGAHPETPNGVAEVGILWDNKSIYDGYLDLCVAVPGLNLRAYAVNLYAEAGHRYSTTLLLQIPREAHLGTYEAIGYIGKNFHAETGFLGIIDDWATFQVIVTELPGCIGRILEVWSEPWPCSAYVTVCVRWKNIGSEAGYRDVISPGWEYRVRVDGFKTLKTSMKRRREYAEAGEERITRFFDSWIHPDAITQFVDVPIWIGESEDHWWLRVVDDEAEGIIYIYRKVER